MFNRRWGCRLNELQDARKHRKAGASPKESKELAALAGMLNKSAGILPPKELPGAATPQNAIVDAISAQPTPTQQLQAYPKVAAPQGSVTALNKVVLTGRMRVGKDWSAEQAGLKVFSIAEPLYALQKLFFGSDDKTLPGARTFLQAAGQIGRNEISAAYPLSVERANFITLVRESARKLPDDSLVDWAAYGTNQDLWLDAMLLRVKRYLHENPGARVAVTNARFSNERTRLTAEGFVHFHCMCSAASWTARLLKAGLTPESPAVKDLSEQLAASLDANVIKQISTQRGGVKLSCVWSDNKVVPPSGRLLTVADFVAMFKT